MARIRTQANASGFELYDAGYMGWGLRTTRDISDTQLFPYTGKLIELKVEADSAKYVGYPRNCKYVTDCTTAAGVPCIVDATDMGWRSFAAYANHGGKYANANLVVTDHDTVALQMKFDTPPGVPVYVDYGTRYTAGKKIYQKRPPDA